jgi:hypothetical protein
VLPALSGFGSALRSTPTTRTNPMRAIAPQQLRPPRARNRSGQERKLARRVMRGVNLKSAGVSSRQTGLLAPLVYCHLFFAVLLRCTSRSCLPTAAGIQQLALLPHSHYRCTPPYQEGLREYWCAHSGTLMHTTIDAAVRHDIFGWPEPSLLCAIYTCRVHVPIDPR